MSKVKPLKSRTMTLYELQTETLTVLAKVRKQLTRMSHEDGLSDSEFIEQVVVPLQHKIRANRNVLKMKEDR